MIVFLLFAILFVLIYMAGLLPGVIKVISAFFGILLLMFMGKVYGWSVVAGGAAAVIAASFLAIYLTYKGMAGGKVKSRASKKMMDEQLARINEKNQRAHAMKEERIRQQIEQTENLGKDS